MARKWQAATGAASKWVRDPQARWAEGAGWEDDLEELTGFLGWHFEHPAAASK